ncbi:MAG: hypothetical protein R6V04_04755 [bacterium]
MVCGQCAECKNIKGDIYISADSKSNQPWQVTLLSCLSSIVTVILLIALIFVLKLGYEGVKAGEMGTMLGFFGIIMLIILIPLFIVMILATIGIFKAKRWAVIFLFTFTCICFPIGFFTLAVGPIIFMGVMFFLGLMLWAEIMCLKSSCYN